MNIKINISDIKIEWLNKRALVLVSIYSHAANKADGTVIDLRAEDVLCTIFAHAKASDNQELKTLHTSIKRELRNSVREQSELGNIPAEFDRNHVSALDASNTSSTLSA